VGEVERRRSEQIVSKGSTPRKVDKTKFDAEYERIFKRVKVPSPKPATSGSK